MKIFKIYFLISFNIYNYSNIITFFVNEYGYRLEPEHKFFHGLTKKIIKEHTKKLKFPIFSTYAGYLTETTNYGQIVFPRSSNAVEFDVLVTNEIEPIFLIPYTIGHWKVTKEADYQMYKIKRVKEKGEYFWEVTDGELPKNRELPKLTIIIFEKPKNVDYLHRKFKTDIGAQILLPPVYIKPHKYDIETAMFMINSINLFKKVFYSSGDDSTNQNLNKSAYSFEFRK